MNNARTRDGYDIYDNISRNPLRLTIYKERGVDENYDGDDEEQEFGEASVTLSGPMGFTDAVAHHFYKKADGPYVQTAENTVDVISLIDGMTVMGNIAVRVKLTCHGLETRQGIVPISTMPDRPQLRPIFVDPVDLRFDMPIDQPSANIMYDDVQANKTETREKDYPLLRCRRYDFLPASRRYLCTTKFHYVGHRDRKKLFFNRFAVPL